MRWEDERYVRVYTRDTPEWCLLSWEARGIFLLLLRAVDRAGLLQLGRAGARAVAALLRAPLDVVERALTELIADGCVELRGEVLCIPNFQAAQEARQSDKARQRASRERARTEAMSQNVTPPSQNVTDRHEASQEVTSGHTASLLAVLSRTELSSDPPLVPPSGGEPTEVTPGTPPPAQAGLFGAEAKPKASRKKPASAMPADWTPPEALFALGAELGLDRHRVESELASFKDHHAAKGTRFSDWDAAARTWIRNVPKYSRNQGGSTPRNRSTAQQCQIGDKGFQAGTEFTA